MGQSLYLEIVAALYQAAVQTELWPETLELLADYLNADSGMLLSLPMSLDGGFIIHRRLREDLNQVFFKHHTRNPYGLAFARAPIGKALTTDAVLPRDVLKRSAFYADILAPQGIADIIAVRHRGLSRGGPGGILFNFSKGRTNRAERAATRLNNLVSHLSRAVDLTLLTRRLSACERQFEGLLESMSGAVAFLDRHGAILKMTPAAVALLNAADGLSFAKNSHPSLVAQHRNDAVRLASRIRRAALLMADKEWSSGELLQINRPSGKPALLIRVTSFPKQFISPWDSLDASARVMVQIVDPLVSVAAQAESLRLLSGLTAAETRVAEMLGSGLGLVETARALGISLSTVKTHAKRVFIKADVHSSAALVRLMASIPVSHSAARTDS